MSGRDDSLADDLAGDLAGFVLPVGGSGLGQRLSKAIRREWARNTSAALAAAEASSGLSREDLAEWIEREPRAVPLYLKVLWAAGMNGHDSTLRAMGAVLGHAAKATARGDDDALARAELSLQAMGDLNSLHFRILAVLAESAVVVTDAGGDNLIQFTTRYVSDKAGVPEPLAAQCLLNLASCGLTSLAPVLGDNAFPLTDLGRAVLRAAQQTS